MTDTPFDNPARRAAVKIVKRLRNAGHVAYLAGGCVRDELLGFVPKDYDVATDADPDRVRTLFRNSRFVGEAFGVVLVRMRSDEVDAQTGRKPIHQIEVATFRAEWGYEDGRHPTEVRFTDAEQDAQRRDFTINGLFEDPLATDEDDNNNDRIHKNGIIDFVGGVADLKQSILRAIGDPSERFGEDYLRMLRAVRFTARFGFELESKTAAAIRDHASKLSSISRERIGAEVLATLDGPQPSLGIQLIESLGLDGAVLDESVYPCALRTVTNLAMEKRMAPIASSPLSPAVWLAAWLVDRDVFVSEDDTSNAIDSFELKRVIEGIESLVPAKGGKALARWRHALCLANDLRDALRDLLVALPAALQWSTLSIAQRKRLLARVCWPAANALLHAMSWSPSCAVVVTGIDDDAPALFEQGVAPPRLLSGDDLIAMGIKPGKSLGKLLESVYDEQLELRVTTRDQAVVWINQQIQNQT